MRGHYGDSERFAHSKWLAVVCSLLAWLMVASAFGQSIKPTTTNDEVAALIKKLQGEHPSFHLLIWNASGQLISASLPYTDASDTNLVLLSQITSLQKLTIQRNYKTLTAQGYETLAGFTNLTALNLFCGGNLVAGEFEKVCRLDGLKKLTLWGAYPPQREYTNLLALTNLEEFSNTACTNFGPQEVKLLTNLTNLKSIRLELSNASHQQDTNVLSSLKNLTNLSVYFQRP